MNDAEYVDALSMVHLVTENQFPAPISTNLLTQPSSGTDKLRRYQQVALGSLDQTEPPRIFF